MNRFSDNLAKETHNERVKWFSNTLTAIGVAMIAFAFIRPIFSAGEAPDVMALTAAIITFYGAYLNFGNLR